MSGIVKYPENGGGGIILSPSAPFFRVVTLQAAREQALREFADAVAVGKDGFLLQAGGGALPLFCVYTATGPCGTGARRRIEILIAACFRLLR